MKNKLQYAYTISVFMGVLLTAYMMMNQGTTLRVPNRNFQSGGFRAEAQVVDPAVSQLLEMENALAKVPPKTAKARTSNGIRARRRSPPPPPLQNKKCFALKNRANRSLE